MHSSRRIPWMLVLAAVTAACQQAPILQQTVVSVPAARLVLKLDGLFGDRRLLYAPSVQRMRVTIDGPDVDAPVVNDVTLGPAGSSIAIDQVPPGAVRVVTLQGLDPAGNDVPGTRARTAGTLLPGLTTLTVSRASTLLGDTIVAIEALDHQFNTQVITQVKLDDLAAAIAGYTRALSAPDPSLMDATAIAYGVYHANGAPPNADATFLQKAGTVVLRSSGWPPGEQAIATLDDPLSAPLAIDDGGVHVLGPVKPGTWSLTVTPQIPGLGPITRSVTVTAGGSVQVPIAFPQGQAQADMPQAQGAAAAGYALVAGADALIMLGGVVDNDSGSEDLKGGQQLSNGKWINTFALANGVVRGAGASYSNRLFVFGGGAQGLPTANVLRYDPAEGASATVLGQLPGGHVLEGAAAATMGDQVYLVGGDDGAALVGKAAVYDPKNGVFTQTVVPDLPTPRTDLTAAALDGKLYVFGGGVPIAEGDLTALKSVAQAEAYTPGVGWKAIAPMPTARRGAVAVAVDKQIWVIGGADSFGGPLGSVEVYNPASNVWALMPPLQVPRAYASAALLGGKVTVAGGVLGGTPSYGLPSAAVEVLKP